MPTFSVPRSFDWPIPELRAIYAADSRNFNCVGTTLKGQRCKRHLAYADVVAAQNLLDALPSAVCRPNHFEEESRELARLVLCKKDHSLGKSQDQVSSMVRQWDKCIQNYLRSTGRLVGPSRSVTRVQSRPATVSSSGTLESRQPASAASNQHALPGVTDATTVITARDSHPIRVVSFRFNAGPTLPSSPPTVTAATWSSSETRQSEAESPCMICLDAVGSNGTTKALPCQHSFCGDCISRWLREHRTCPLCRDDGTTPPRPQHQEEFVRYRRLLTPVSRRREAAHGGGGLTGRNSNNASPASTIASRTPPSAENVSAQSSSSTADNNRQRNDQMVPSLSSPPENVQSSTQASWENGSGPPPAEEEEECGICLETLSSTADDTTTLRCSHRFHSACASAWAERSQRCPYRCRP
jgi:hypothetical protein